MIFFGSKHFFTSLSFSRYRDTILFADNLTTDQAHLLGNLHNADAELQRKATFMDKLSLARKSWFDEGTDEVQQHWVTKQNDGGGDSTVLQEWKYAVLKKLGEGTLKADMNRLSPMFVTARWPMENYELLVEIDKKYNKKQLKGQSRKGKKARQYEPTNKDSITSGYVTALNGLEEGEVKNLLLRVLNCDLEMKGLITEGKEIKKRGRFNFKIKELMGCDDEKQVLKRLGKNTVNALYVQYGYAFTATKKTAPASMVHEVNKMNTKWLATQEALKKARLIQRQESGAAADDVVGESGCDITIELDPIFPDEKTFRGSNDPVEENDANRIGKNQFRIVKEDVIGDGTADLTVQEGYSLVILDPPYGITSEEWDQKAWMQKEFSKCLENVITWNTKAEKFTFITFCAAEQLSVFMNELNKNLGVPIQGDEEEHNPLYKGSCTELVWYKTKHFAPGNFIYLSHDCTQPISPTSSLSRWCFCS